MSTTTLMTFLLRTPSGTRSVNLRGSWDNFSKPYPMEKDPRVGSGHWRGCHTFTNIICDGEMKPNNVKRDGGLKMGGTYWYYYELDDDVEFYNDAEPSTTKCPFLPGQVVNVLHVPVHLPDGKSHHTRNGSSKSEFQTMRPEDKFMNPRAAPKPQPPPRLTTSPSILAQPSCWLRSNGSSPLSALSERSVSQPTSGTSRSKKPRKPKSFEKPYRVPSPPRASSLRAALLRIAAP
ncbi:hypothetical protein FQN54_001199 [Arachnomyces sp. PD_36]|nr:hypothetical protein FQN54_001199 [Arachnomyces sp. PD_36]